MPRSFKPALILAIALLCAIASHAGPLTLDDCLREMEQNNPDLYAAREGVNVARANLLQSYSPFLPQVSARASASRNNQELDTGYQATTAYSAGLNASQNLFNGFRDIAALNQSRARFNQAETSLRRVKANLCSDVREAFAELLYAQDALVLDEKIVVRRKENYSLVDMRFEAGSEDKGSLLRSQAFYNQSLLDVAESKRRIRVAQRRLNKALGRPDNMDISVAGKWERADPPAPPEMAELIKATPEYRLAEIQCVIAREQVRIARSGFLPTWDVSANFGLSDDDSLIPQNESWSVGTGIGLDIFNGGQTYFALRSARASLRSFEAQLSSEANSLLLSLESLFTAWQNATERVRLQVELLSAAETRMEIAQIKYSNGLMSFQDWDTIGNELITNQKTMLERERAAFAARALWDKALGVSLIP